VAVVLQGERISSCVAAATRASNPFLNAFINCHTKQLERYLRLDEQSELISNALIK
jgi:hypothetical protein